MTNGQKWWLTIVTAVVVGSAIAMTMGFNKINARLKAANIK